MVSLMKAHGSFTCEYVAREAAQIFGGLAYVGFSDFGTPQFCPRAHLVAFNPQTRGGQGGKVERIYRDVRAYAIPAGSEEIMLDFGVRESLKKAVILGAPIPGIKL
jgi:alkylation response protein AidB-like acyl-CoA dehydrogenase